MVFTVNFNRLPDVVFTVRFTTRLPFAFGFILMQKMLVWSSEALYNAV